MLLTSVLLVGSLSSWSAQPEAQEDSPSDIYQPKVQRQDINEALIDSEDFEVGLFYGQLSIEDFGSEPVSGLRFAYHINEDFFFNLTVGKATAGLTSAEEIFAINLLNDRDYKFYDIAMGWNMLPGEAFIGEKTALNSALYMMIGAGNTSFAGRSQMTVTFGAGYRILINDWLAMYVDARNHMFNSDILGEVKTTHNQEMSVGITVFF